MNHPFTASSSRENSRSRALRFLLPVLVLCGLASDPLAAAPTGQFWWVGEGNATDARVAYANNDGSAQVVNTDNNPSLDLVTSFVSEIGLDTAAGFYFAIVNGGPTGSNARMIRGVIGSTAAPVVVADFRRGNIATDPGDNAGDDLIVNALHVDPINKKIYTTWQDPAGEATNTGIRQYSYDPATGAVTDQSFLIRADLENNKPIASGYDLLDVRDFDIDPSTNTLYFTELFTGTLEEMGIYRMDMTSKVITQMVSSTQFPDSGAGGFIIDVEVDPTTDKVYFTSESRHPYPDPTDYNAAQNKLWVVPQGATNATATAVPLTGLPAGSHIYPGDMVFDQSLRQLYIESEETDSISTDDVIYVFQLDAAGTSASLVRTLTPSPVFNSVGANIQGMAFDAFATLSTTANTNHAFEQVAPVSLLASDPVIADIDGDHLANATVTLSGSFVGSGDDLFVLDGATRRNSGVISSTNITVSRTVDGGGNQKLTFTGYDTLAHYQQVLGKVQLFANGDNPTNGGGNTTRTATWQINDGAAGNPAMTLNAASTNLRSTTLTIDPVNDQPTLNAISNPASIAEDAGQQTMILSGVSEGPANESSQTLTITATSDNIALIPNPTVSFAEGNTTGSLSYTPVANANGAAIITVTVTDNGGTANGGENSIQRTFTVNVTAVNDAPSANADSLADVAQNAGKQVIAFATLLANDTKGPSNESAQALTITAVSNPVGGTVAINGTNVEFAPTTNFIGAAGFSYTVTDNGTTNGVNDFKTANGSVSFNIVSSNHNPVATADSIARFATRSTNVKITALLANDTDVDGDTLIFVSAGGASHGTTSILNNIVIYTPNAGYPASDSFTYLVSDGHGGTATGTVTVTVAPGEDTANVEMLADGSVKLSFHGINGVTYKVQSSDNLAAGSWVDRTTATADGSGNFTFADPGPLPERRFYRCGPL